MHGDGDAYQVEAGDRYDRLQVDTPSSWSWQNRTRDNKAIMAHRAIEADNVKVVKVSDN